jgi:hypothetical protein
MADYSTEELQAIATAPMMTGLAVAMIDMGIVSTAIEAAAMSKQIAGAAAKYPTNSIIQAVFSDAAIKSGQVKPEKPDIKPEAVQSGAVIEQTITSIRTAIAAVEGKATVAEIAEYKQFIYDCGQAVAEAAGSGLFGSGSPKISEQEAAALAQLQAALGL